MNSKRQFAKTLIIAGSLALGLMLQATPAEAGKKHKDRRQNKRDHQRHEQRYDRNDHRRDARYGYDYRIVDGYRHDYRIDNRHNRGHMNRSRQFRIPNRIIFRSGMDYRPYFYGERFHRGHGHMHMVYRFPVYTDYGVRYHAVSYCQGDYYRTGRFVYNGPRLGFSIRF